MNKYICLNCKKEYKIEIYYKKHCEKKICIIQEKELPKCISDDNELEQELIIHEKQLPKCSIEQKDIIESIKDNNVVIDSVAGSGKTTTILHISQNNEDKNILLLTYNSRLKVETRERVIEYDIKNLETHSYHSFCVKYYNNKCFTDSEILKIINEKEVLKKGINYDIIILDEAQDINILYYELICKIYIDNKNKECKICILGDKKQSIYGFNGADERYIVNAENIFNFNNINWIKQNLSKSFRITKEMSEFLNKCMLNEERILSDKIINIKPRYIICDSFGNININENKPYEEVEYYLKKGYLPEDIFILAPSIKSFNSPIRVLENKIKEEKGNTVNIYVPNSEEEKLDMDIISNKLVFSTIHQVKGLERKIVILFNFDDSYFKYYKKDANPYICPNELYVATTRAKEHLTLLHHYSNDYLPFLNKRLIMNYCNIIGKVGEIKKNKSKPIDTSVTDLIKNLPIYIIEKCINYLTIETKREINKKIKIPIKTKQEGSIENVSDLNGIAIPSYFELKTKGEITILNELKKKNNNIKENLFSDIIEEESLIDKIKIEDINEVNILEISNEWNSYKSGFLFKKYQINNYNWLSKENLKISIERLESLNISKNAMFEKRYELKENRIILNREINGYVDCIDNNNIYEFKCVEKIQNEHILQLSIYMYMHKDQMQTNINENEYHYYLYNILTDELIEISCIYEKLKEMIKYIIEQKYYTKNKKTDIEFMENTKVIYDKYI